MTMNKITMTLVLSITLNLGLFTIVHGFANYMMSSSGCYVELDTDEVIMNYRVLPQVSDAPLQLTVVSPTQGLVYQPIKQDFKQSSVQSTFQTVTIDTTIHNFPMQIELQVVSSSSSSSLSSSNVIGGKRYEYILNLIGGDEDAASFVHGGCKGDRRAAGRSGESTITLTLESAPTPMNDTNGESGGLLVQAAWAAGHEPVKLLRGIQFVVTNDNVDETMEDL